LKPFWPGALLKDGLMGVLLNPEPKEGSPNRELAPFKTDPPESALGGLGLAKESRPKPGPGSSVERPKSELPNRSPPSSRRERSPPTESNADPVRGARKSFAPESEIDVRTSNSRIMGVI